MKIQMKVILIILIVCLALGFVSGCINRSSETDPQNKAENTKEKYVIRINTNMSEADRDNSAFGDAFMAFKNECETNSDGRLVIDIYYNSQLGSGVSELIGGAQHGAFEMFNLVATSWAEYTDAFLPVNLPYLFTDEEVVINFIEGPQGKLIEEKVLEDTGMKVVFYGYQGFRNFVNNVRPITCPDDLKGLKLRVLSDPYTIKAMETLGATTIQLPYSELYTSSQQGLIDGSDGPYQNILNSKLYEVQKYVSATHNLYTLGVVCISQSAYDNLPEDLKSVFDAACETANELAKGNPKYEKASLEELKKYVEFNELTAEQRQAFVDAMKPVYDMAREAMGQKAWDEFINEIETIKSNLK